MALPAVRDQYRPDTPILASSMAEANLVHPSAIIGARVDLGTGNTIGPGVVILGPVRIGDDNWIGPGAVIGTPGEMRNGPHPSWDDPQGVGVAIGDRNVIREHATIQQGTVSPTSIGNDCYIQAKAYVPHEGVIGDDVTLASGVQIGGHGWIGQGANLGFAVQVLQRSCIGAHAMVGMNATVTRDVPPFALAMGTPARVTGANRVGMRRNGLSAEVVEMLDRHFKEGSTACPHDADEEVQRAFRLYETRRSQRDSNRS